MKIERPNREQADRAIQRAGALCSVAGIWFFFAVSRHQGVGLVAILEAAFFVSAAVCVLVVEARRASAPALGLTFAYVAALFVGTFSWLYSLDGSSNNFTHALSHLDAFYFALGTLSTAGTGNLSAISESARLIQSVEMATGMGLVLFGVAAVVARLAKT